jgi:hypothetical protein
MRKISSIIRHLVCISRKLRRRQDFSWHWQHILREFGVGRYCLWTDSKFTLGKPSRQPRGASLSRGSGR